MSTYCGVTVLQTASTQEPLTRTEAKLWLRVDEHQVDEDPLIDALITRARKAFEERHARSVFLQTFDTWLEEFPASNDPITLPIAPLVAVTKITGFSSTEATDSGGTDMTTSDYYVDTAHEYGRVMPISAGSYPSVTRSINGARVRFTAGYSSSPSGIPEGVKAEIKSLLAILYEHRGDEPTQQALMEAARGNEDALPSWG